MRLVHSWDQGDERVGCHTDPSFILSRFASVKSRAVEVLASDVHLMVVSSIT